MEKQKIKIVVKLVLFSVIDGKLKILLPERKVPYRNLDGREAFDDCVKKILDPLYGIKIEDFYLEQLYTFSYPVDQNLTEVTVSYFLLIPEHIITPVQKKDWVDYKSQVKDMKDQEIIKYAVQRLQGKVEYTNIVYSLLPTEFTFSQMQKIYEAVLEKNLDKRNFRKKIMSLSILKTKGKMQKQGRTRPAQIFSFKQRKLTFVEIL